MLELGFQRGNTLQAPRLYSVSDVINCNSNTPACYSTGGVTKPSFGEWFRMKHVSLGIVALPSQIVEAENYGCVYLVKHPHDLYKIGIARNPAIRLAELQVGSPYLLELVGSMLTNEVVSWEQDLHARYKEQRVRGEWFKLSDSDVFKLLKLFAHQDALCKERLRDSVEEQRQFLLEERYRLPRLLGGSPTETKKRR